MTHPDTSDGDFPYNGYTIIYCGGASRIEGAKARFHTRDAAMRWVGDHNRAQQEANVATLVMLGRDRVCASSDYYGDNERAIQGVTR